MITVYKQVTVCTNRPNKSIPIIVNEFTDFCLQFNARDREKEKLYQMIRTHASFSSVSVLASWYVWCYRQVLFKGIFFSRLVDGRAPSIKFTMIWLPFITSKDIVYHFKRLSTNDNRIITMNICRSMILVFLDFVACCIYTRINMSTHWQEDSIRITARRWQFDRYIELSSLYTVITNNLLMSPRIGCRDMFMCKEFS